MNLSIIRYILAYLLKTEAALLLLPTLVGAYYGENQAWYYLIVAAICGFIGIILGIKKPRSHVFYLKEGCVATSLSWILLSVFGALPFYLSGEIPSYINALFETISGFTTTGTTILDDLESLSHCALFWRSFTHWIGGMGVLVFILAVIPLGGGSHINLMRAESPGPSVGKLVPTLKSTARILYLIYLGMSVIEAILLLIGGMPKFDTVCLTFGTAGTGGFGVRGDSIASYGSFCQWVITIFMILFGINFNFYYFIIFRQIKKAFTMEEVRKYLAIILFAIVVITINIMNTVDSLGDAISQASFQVAAIISSTGYSTVDFDTWSTVCKTILVMLMFVGACAGSTGGGMKVSRYIIEAKTVIKELGSFIHPKSVKKIEMDGKPVEHEVVRSVNVYFMTFIGIFAISLFIVSFNGYDLTSNFTAVATTINNIGPGLNLSGPTESFNFFSPLSKFVFMFDMLAGRLELFPLLILFHPTIWKDAFVESRFRRKQNKELKKQLSQQTNQQ